MEQLNANGNPERKYTLGEMVSFGKFMYSTDRAKQFIGTGMSVQQELTDRLNNVQPADVWNWETLQEPSDPE